MEDANCRSILGCIRISIMATPSPVIPAKGRLADRVLIHVDTELRAKDLLNNRMAYVAVSRGAYDAQLFTKREARRSPRT
jgi:hypothetical protein